MGQGQGKEDVNPRVKNKTVKDKSKHGLGARTFSSTSQVVTDSENGGFTLPWDLRGPQEQDSDFMKKRPLPTIPPENEETLLDHPDIDINESEMYFVQYDFDAGANENQLSVKKSELIRVISFDDQKVWCEGQNRNGKIGWLPFTYLVPFDSLHKFDWFHGQISRNRAEYLLNSGINGSFLMRESESAPGQHSLSLRYDGRVYHYRVYFDDNDNVYVREEAKFKTLEQLVKYHSDEAGGLVTNLRYPALKVDKPPVYGFCQSEDEWEIARMDIFMGQKLGGGQYGEVYKAEYKKYGATVAVKTLKEDTDIEEFLKEADVMKLIKHPNLVKLIGVCTRERPIYIITEYMPLGNLLEYLRQAEKSDLPATTLIYIASQVSAAMKYLEEQNFIHRDLAARNCLVGDNHLIKVADFGLARSMQQDYYKAHSGAKFPIKWTSPEALAYNKFSTKSDVWAFGVLMWEIATYGKSPYPGSDLNQVYGLLEQGYRMECPEGCPSAVYELMRDCWSWNPAERPTFRDICHRLDYMFDTKNVDEEVQQALRTRPLSMHASDIEGMVLPPKPPKRRTGNDVADGKKNAPLPALPSNAPPKPTLPPPRKPMPQIPSEESLKKDKSHDKKITLMSRKFKGKDKKASEKSDQDESSTAEESVGHENNLHSHTVHGNQSMEHSTVQSMSGLTGSKISLNEIQGGLSKVLTKRKHKSDIPSSAKENAVTDNDHVSHKTNEHFEHSRRPLLPPPSNRSHVPRPKSDVESSDVTPVHTLTKSSKPPLPSRPITPSKYSDAKPQLPVKPALKPRPSVNSPKLPDRSPKMERYSSSNVELIIDVDNLKRELIPISESMQTVFKVINNLITLAELRQSENINAKTDAASKQCSILVDDLSQYRDSIGPVTRMKVNKHLTVIESQVNDFTTVSRNMPRIATATDLEKMSKSLSVLCDSLKALSIALPYL